jgi:nicotinate phosphoribosyltransferase
MTRFSPALLTDLYELTMLEAYLEEGMHETAVFSLFVRRLPEHRNYLLACGLDDVLTILETLRFDEAALSYLDSLKRFSPRFLRDLAQFRFTGDVFAVPEGTPFFAQEPILEIAAPLAEAQFVETIVINQIHLQTVLASKAARVVAAAQGRQVVDFGLRRMHGIDAGMKAARSAFIAGAEMSSNVLAGLSYGIPPSGTMAHSYVSAFAREIDSFRAFARAFPGTRHCSSTPTTPSPPPIRPLRSGARWKDGGSGSPASGWAAGHGAARQGRPADPRTGASSSRCPHSLRSAAAARRRWPVCPTTFAH